MSQLTPEQRIRLRTNITDHFGLEELKTLCFDLDVRFDSLVGEGLDTKVVALIVWFEKRNRIPELIANLHKERSNFDWDPRPEPRSPDPDPDPKKDNPPKPRKSRSLTLIVYIAIIVGVVMVGLAFIPKLIGIPQPVPTTLTPTQTPTHMPSPPATASLTSSPTPVIIVVDTMNSLDWTKFDDRRFISDTAISTINLSLVDGVLDKAIQIDFDLRQDGYAYVGISKEITPGLLTGTQSLRFRYLRSTGQANTVELKLFHTPDADGKVAVYSYSRRESAVPGSWATFDQFYSAFDCGDTCKTPEQKLDPAQVWKLEIAISHQLGGAPGPGRVLIDQIDASCAGCVAGRGYGCPANMADARPGMSDKSCTDTFTLLSPFTTTQIRIEMTKRALVEYGYSLYEVEAYGPGDSAKNLLKGGAVAVSSTEDARYAALNATDGDKTSRWGSQHRQDPQWLEITLPQSVRIDRIELRWEQAYAAEYYVIVKPVQ